MKKIKIMTIIGTRPEIIRLSCVMKKLDSNDMVEHIVVHTGQNYDYELNEIFFKDFGLRKPDYFLNASGETATKTIGNIFIAIDDIFDKILPDAILILGDTNSCLCAIPAKKRKIPIFHMEAGNRCFDQRVPEEINRKIVDHVADINLTYSDISREYILAEGFPPDRVIKTGSPMYEVIKSKIDSIYKSNILEKLNLIENNYFVVSAHRDENINSDKNFFNLVNILNSIADVYKLPIIFSTHPRTRKRIEKEGVYFNKLIKLLKPLNFSDYNKLQIKSKAVLSDSGTISEESSILKFKALNLREAHERPEAMEEAVAMMVGLNKERVMQGLEILNNQETKSIKNVRDYMVENVSEKIIRIIISYVDYVNQVVWCKGI